MPQRLLRAAMRLHVPSECTESAAYALRPEQSRVFSDFAEFLLDVATAPGDTAVPYGRIVLPPRTGKTVIAGHIISRTGLTTTFVAPTRALVEQTARELAAQLPGVPIGVYYGDRKEVVEYGVNVTTYAILQRAFAEHTIPSSLATAALILVDEAHHCLTASRVALLRHGFVSGALRIALTATPDYDDRRVLCRYFPSLIHEITLEEALDLELLAPLRLWVAEVDADGSQVRVVAGDYEELALGRVMSAAPFARAVEVFRYRPENRRTPALIACASRQQAHDLHQYLLCHRPKESPAPALILGDTPGPKREDALRMFACGQLDTLIQVGVLVEGWNSPRCKLLIDLAPSMSRVRATQKFFRVMTRLGAAEARIYILLPVGLPALPILPVELFGPSVHSYTCGELIGKQPQTANTAELLSPLDCTAIADVRLKQRLLLHTTMQRPLLDGKRHADVVAVLSSCPDFSLRRPCNLVVFRRLWFDHPLFRGRGEFLLRWLGILQTREAYVGFLSQTCPEGGAFLLLTPEEQPEPAPSWHEKRLLLRALRQPSTEPGVTVAEFTGVWRAVTGCESNDQSDPEAQLMRQDEIELLAYALQLLPPHQRRFVAKHFGLLGEREHTLLDLADAQEVSRSRAGQVVEVGLRKLRACCQQADEGLTVRRRYGSDRVCPPFRRGLTFAPLDLLRQPSQRSRWVAMSSPLVPSRLLEFVAQLLEQLGQSTAVCSAQPTVTSWLVDGVPQIQACWEAGGQRICLLRDGHIQVRHGGGEHLVMRLEAEVSGLPAQTRVLLRGPLGQLDRYLVEGSAERAVGAAWRSALGITDSAAADATPSPRS